MKKTLCALLAVITTACNETQNTNNIVYINDDNLPPVKEIKLEKIEVNEQLCMASQFHIIDDSIMVAIHLGSQDPYYVSVYNMNSWKTLGEYFKRGNGPDELIGIYPGMNRRELNISDFLGRYGTVNVDSVISLGEKYCPHLMQFEVPEALGQHAILNDSTRVMHNLSYYKNERMNIVFPDSIPEFFFLRLDGSPYNKIIPNPRICSENVDIMINKSKKRVLVGYNTQPMYKLFDGNMNLIKTIMGPDPDDCEIIKISDDVPGAWHTGHSCSYSVDSYETDQYAISLNTRRHKMPIDDGHIQYGENTAELLFFDWDGNVKARFKSPEMPLHCFTFNEKNNTLYVTSYDENEELSLYKAILDI